MNHILLKGEKFLPEFSAGPYLKYFIEGAVIQFKSDIIKNRFEIYPIWLEVLLVRLPRGRPLEMCLLFKETDSAADFFLLSLTFPIEKKWLSFWGEAALNSLNRKLVLACISWSLFYQDTPVGALWRSILLATINKLAYSGVFIHLSVF